METRAVSSVPVRTLTAEDTIVALGTPLGGFVHSTDTSVETALYYIRNGSGTCTLPWGNAPLWAQALIPTTVADLRTWATKHDIDDFDDAAHWLIDHHLWLVWPQDSESTHVAFKTIRAMSTGVGLGNTLEDPGRFVIANLAGDPVLEADGVRYMAWTCMDGNHTLFDVATQVADLLPIDVGTVVARLADGFLVNCRTTTVVVLEWAGTESRPG